jgi:hypothetical protein
MNDILPEEQDPQFEELITLLREADLNPPFIDPAEHAQIISRARARLFPTDYEVAQLAVQEPGSLPSKSSVRRSKHGQLIHLVNMLAAVLVVAALIGSVLLLFGPWSPLRQDRTGSVPHIGPVGVPVKVGGETADGFERMFKITPGPYFLGELLEVDLSITNHTHTTYWLGSTVSTSPCPGILKITTIGGGSPHVANFQRSWASIPETMFKCNTPFVPPLPLGVRVAANHTITIKQYALLTNSGHLTLTANVAFQKTTNEFGGHFTLDISTTASLQLFVSALAPLDRQLSVNEQKTQVVVAVPPAITGHLLYETGFVCSQGDSGVYETGVGAGLRPTIVVRMPRCTSATPQKVLWWVYVVGVPGYALVSGKVNVQ